MIISTGLRTDIINHYSEWLFERFREGYVLARNPLFPNKVTRYLLSPDTVDAVTFCSKNYTPALHRLQRNNRSLPLLLSCHRDGIRKGF